MVFQHMDLLRAQHVVLASASPRRLSILENAGLRVTVCVSHFAENLSKAAFATAGDYALATARRKADGVVAQLGGDFDILIAADTVVALPPPPNCGAESEKERIIEKAETRDAAAALLREIAGRAHSVCSGVAIAARDGRGALHWREIKARTVVRFAAVEEAEIAAYVEDRRRWEGKAGAYGIQDAAGCWIAGIDGDYYNVMGLPLQAVCAELDSLIRDGIIQ